MPASLDFVDQLLALDVGRRGIGRIYQRGGARGAARSLARGRRVVVITGFAFGPAMPETDGPPGAAVLGRALGLLGKAVTYVTDRVAAPVLRAALESLGERAAVTVLPDAEAVAATHLRLSRDQVSHLVAIERPGRAADGAYWSARGEPITAWNGPIDALFLRPPRRAITVGIGDGGNEVGMGNVRARLRRQGALARKIASVVRVDHLVVAGVSNWGAYGVVAHLSALAGRPLLHTAAEERRLVAACVEAGAVDGMTRRREPRVDGLPLETHAAMVELLRALAEQRIEGGARS